ncbi:leucine-rich repeat flightless-interacting protein 1 isoform X2 [Gouania willdenowi]|uniref:leucine-rich repeat flightless-interacting protein 1 isoform X2 n=1 Tax=Gouania willdenowi TaxID=441366 RepID=UPI0010559053|nr:leucine-rich repeat flightless-interacting protein 1-like isoform X2 [Gouania willdenowi]
MLSATLDASGSPKKRVLSRGLSEDESLRSIISESESSSRRLIRSDSRASTQKKRTDSQSEQDFFMGLPEMVELQASYDEVVQELRGLEVERETLLFQVDVLQDTLEGVEELLAEAQREAGHASLELEREREAKKKLESIVSSLMQEVERLKEERNTGPPAPANETNEAVSRGHQTTNTMGLIRVVHGEETSSLLCEPRNSGGLAAAEKGGQGEGSKDMGSAPTELWKPLGHLPSLALETAAFVDGVFQRPYEDEPELSADTNDSDSISAYEDASAETPEQDVVFPGDEDVADSEIKGMNRNGNPQTNGGENQEPKNPDACIVS